MNTEEFTKKYYVDRKNTQSIKWDMGQIKYQRDDLLPMWVADMDFKCPNEVTEHLTKDLQNSAFGYTHLPDVYYDAWIKWNQAEHQTTYQKDWVRFSDGAVSGIFHCINAFTEVGDSILIQTPTYPPFRNSVISTHRQLVEIPLVDHDGYFEMDRPAIAQAIIKHNVKMFILCSPHNPIGRVWTNDELTWLIELCVKHDVLLLSDEVHQDLIMQGYKQLPILSFDEKYFDHLIALNACAKTFNLAQFSHSHVLIPNAQLREKYDAYVATQHFGSPKYLNAMASCYAYQYGSEWLHNILAIVEENYHLIVDTLKNYPIEISKLEGTYLIFIDLSNVLNGKDIEDFMINDVRVLPNFGKTFDEQYTNWVRINLATSQANVKEFLKRLLGAIA